MKTKPTKSKTLHVEVSQTNLASMFEMAYRRTHFALALVLCVFSYAASTCAQEALWKTYLDAGTSAYDDAQKINKEDHQKRRERYAEAEKRFELARREAEAFGPQDLRLATTLQKLLSVYVQQDRYAEAEPLSRRVIAIWEKSMGPDAVATATANFEIGDFYYSKGKYAESAPFYKRAVAIVEKTERLKSLQKNVEGIAPQTLRLATTLERLISAYVQQDKYAEAEPFGKELIAISEHSANPNPVAEALANLDVAHLYYNHEKYVESEPFYNLARTILEQSPPTTPERQYIPNLLYLLANAYNAQDKYGEAVIVLNAALKIEEKEHGKFEIFPGNILFRLSIAYEGLQKYGDAEKSYNQAIGLFEKLPAKDPGRRSIADLQYRLANVYNAQGKYADAESVLLRALEGAKKDQEDDLLVGKISYRLGATYGRLSKYGDAERSYNDAIAIFKHHSKDDWAFSALRDLGNLYRSQGEHTRAETLFKGIISALENDKNSKESLADDLLTLGRVYQAQEKYAEALHAFERVRAIYEDQNLKLDDPRQATIRNNIAKAYYQLGNYAQAEPLYLQAIEMAKKSGKPTTGAIAAWYEKNYALLLYARGDKARAEPLFNRALAILAKDKDEGETDLATSRFELAELYRTQERYSEAAPLFKEALEQRTKFMNPNHLDLAVTMEKYAATLRKLGRLGDAEALEGQAGAIRSKHSRQ